MKITQRLSSGLCVRQDFRSSVRFVMFETGVEGWQYGTDGGTLFLISIRGRVFGVTCCHVRGSFDWCQLRITEARFGRQFARLKSAIYPSDPTGEAVDTDILDLTVIEFADEVGADFFTDPPYILDASTCGTSNEGDALIVSGALKEKSDLSGPRITPVFCRLEFTDRGATSADPSLREAYAQYSNPEFSLITGLSGSPVFNASTNKLAGMVSRGSLNGHACTIWYIDISDIMQLLTAITEGRPRADYVKNLRRLVRQRVSVPIL